MVSSSMVELDGSRLCVRSSMRMAEAAALAEAGGRLLPLADLIIDLSAVGTADSSALAVLLNWKRLQQDAGASWRVEAAPSGVLSLARLYGVADTLGLT